LESYKTALSLRPDFAIAHGNHAACLYDIGDVQGAIKGFKHAIHLEFNYPDVHNNLGNAYKTLNRIDEAIQCYRTALQLKPVSPSPSKMPR
jgi:protein O-GlcNAc transferase